MFRRATKWILLVLTFSVTVVSAAQDSVCQQLIESALRETDEICNPAQRNQACYGHDLLQAQPQPGFDSFNFDEVGDIVDVAQIKTLRLSPMDLQTKTWGVALMNLQANLPDEQPNQNVRLLLFGNVQVRNIINPPRLVDVTLQSTGNVNVRRQPADDAFVIGTLAAGTSVTARGRSPDNNWIYIDVPNQNEEKGWISSVLVRDFRDVLAALSEVEPAMSQYGPMQAFYLRTGEDTTTCEEAPKDGLLIQTPEGVAEVRLWINQVKIRLGSTIFIQANPGKEMVVKTLEGHASVEALGVEYTAMAGTSVSIPLNDDENPSAPPRPPKPIQAEDVATLPVEHLDRRIEIEILPTATATTQELLPTSVSTTPEPTATQVVTEEPTPSATVVVIPSEITATERPTLHPTDVPPTAVPPTEVATQSPAVTEEPTPVQTQEPMSAPTAEPSTESSSSITSSQTEDPPSAPSQETTSEPSG